MEVQMTDSQKTIIANFLEDEECDKLIEEWLKEAGISGLKVKLAMKLVLPALGKLVSGFALRGGTRLNDALKGHWESYNDFTMWVSKWLILKVEDKYKRKALLKDRLEPVSGVDEEDWQNIDEQAKVWITELEKLNFIALSLGKLDAKVSLRIDKPGRLDAEQPSRLLRYYNAFIPLIGREIEKEAFKNFWEKNVPFSWQPMLGDGGVGKTRLALELAKEFSEQGWFTGFISEESLKNFVRHDGFTRWGPLTDTLIIIDYAASKLENLKSLFNRCAEWALEESQESDAPRLRILLLERHGDRDQGWLSEILKSTEGRIRDEINDAMGLIYELKVPGHDDLQQTMRDILRVTMVNWENLTKRNAPDLPAFDASDLRDLANRTDGRPLYLQMAAIHACEIGDASQIFHWGKSKLLHDAAGREKDYIEKQGQRLELDPSQKKLLLRSAAILCLTGPRSRNDDKWLNLLKQEAESLGYAQDPGRMADALMEVLGETIKLEEEVKISPIYPDLVGEAFAVLELSKAPDLLFQSLQRVIEVGHAESWGNLLRATIDLYGLEEFEKIETWLAPLLRDRNWEELADIESLLPHKTVSLIDFSVQVETTLLAVLPREEKYNAARAGILINLGFRYSALGQGQEALKAVERAEKNYQRLAEKNPDVFEPYLAKSLHSLGICYAELGKRSEALQAAEQAEKIYRRLAEKIPDAFEPFLASSLLNLGIRYSGLDKRDEALQAIEQAEKIYQRLAEKIPEAFGPDLARSFNNLGNCYRELGKRNEALEAIEQAVKIYQRLAEKSPDTFEPDLAKSLGAMGAIHLNFENPGEAKKAFEGGILVIQRLFFNYPQPFDQLMENLAKSYILASENCGEEPNKDLLEPIAAVLSELEKKDE